MRSHPAAVVRAARPAPTTDRSPGASSAAMAASTSESRAARSSPVSQGLTLVHFSAQSEPFLTQNTV